MSDLRQRQRQRQIAIEAQKHKIFQWYAMASAMPDEEIPDKCVIVEDTKHTINGQVYRWHIEPLIPGVRNPQLEVSTLGDNWVCQLNAILAPIKSVGGL